MAASDTLALGAQLLPLLARPARYWNLGVTGRTQAQCYATRAAREGALIEPDKVKIDAGINDLGAGARGADLYAGVARPYMAAMRAMGFRVGLATLLPQASGRYPTGDAVIERERSAYNAAARADTAETDFLIDRAAVPVMGGYPDSCADATLYSPSVGGAGLHPTTLGYTHLASVHAAAINAALASPGRAYQARPFSRPLGGMQGRVGPALVRRPVFGPTPETRPALSRWSAVPLPLRAAASR